MKCKNCNCELVSVNNGLGWLHENKINIGTKDKPRLWSGAVMLSRTTVCGHPEPKTK